MVQRFGLARQTLDLGAFICRILVRIFLVLSCSRLIKPCRPRNSAERALVYPFLGVFLGAWAGIIPIALDWDRPWQVGDSDSSRPQGVVDAPSGMAPHPSIRSVVWIHNFLYCCCYSRRRHIRSFLKSICPKPSNLLVTEL